MKDEAIELCQKNEIPKWATHVWVSKEHYPAQFCVLAEGEEGLKYYTDRNLDCWFEGSDLCKHFPISELTDKPLFTDVEKVINLLIETKFAVMTGDEIEFTELGRQKLSGIIGE